MPRQKHYYGEKSMIAYMPKYGTYAPPAAGTARSAAQALPSLDGVSRQAARETLEGNGFKLWRPNPGGYERWDNPDGSRVWIGPDGGVDRIPPGMSGKGWRAAPDGTIRRPHPFPEERVN